MSVNRRKFAIAASAAAGLLAAYAIVTDAGIGGQAVTVSVEDYGETAAAAVAALCCLLAARRSSGRLRAGWALLAISAASWSLGACAWAVLEVNLHRPVPFPSIADAGFVGAIPFAAAALLAFPFGPSSALGRVRALLDGLIVATSLTYVAWDAGLGSLAAQMRVGVVGGSLAVTYPAADILMLILLVTSARRALRQLGPVVATLCFAFAAILVADTSFALLTLDGAYGILGSAYDAGWVAGYLAIGLAAFWPAPATVEATDDGPVEMWQLAMPWVTVSAVIVAGVWSSVAGRNGGVLAIWIGSVMGVFFLASQILTLNDALRLLVRSRRAEAQLGERSALLSEVIGRAPLGIARLDGNLQFLDGNQRLCEMLAVPQRALVGSSICQFLSDDDAAQALRRLERMNRGELDEAEVDSEMHRADGRMLWVHRNIKPVRNDRGSIQYFLLMFEDMTAKHAVEKAELANLAALERLSRLKSEFMSMVSHEFRTALTGIQGYSELMSSEEVSPEEVKEFAGDINSDALRLNRMITEMLDLDRIESGRMAMRMEPIDLNRLLGDAADRARMTTQKHEIISHLDPSLPLVEADRDRVTQVVANLLSNAVKYAPEGGEIALTSRVDGNNVVVSVQDHGLGIPPEFIGRIFGRYERYEAAGKSQVVGTGLGLAIAQQIIQLHKGRIWVDSTVGQGSTFSFTLPVPVCEAAARPAADVRVA